MEEKFDSLNGMFEVENGHEWLTEKGVEFFANAIYGRLGEPGNGTPLLADYDIIKEWVEDYDVQNGYTPWELYKTLSCLGEDEGVDYMYHCFLRDCITNLLHEHKKTGFYLDLG